VWLKSQNQQPGTVLFLLYNADLVNSRKGHLYKCINKITLGKTSHVSIIQEWLAYCVI